MDAVSADQQPFGFTREDVEALRLEVRTIENAVASGFLMNSGHQHVRILRLASLADRIEALLPPEAD